MTSELWAESFPRAVRDIDLSEIMKISDLFVELPRPPAGLDELGVDDPLVEESALLEAQILGIRLDSLTRQAGVLLEFRQSLQPFPGNTGVLIAKRVTSSRLSAPDPTAPPVACPIVGWRMVESRGALVATAAFSRLGELSVAAESWAFVHGDVPGLTPTPVDYGEHSTATIRQHVAGWDSEMNVIAVSSRSVE
jgi:hypothetical protein